MKEYFVNINIYIIDICHDDFATSASFCCWCCHLCFFIYFLCFYNRKSKIGTFLEMRDAAALFHFVKFIDGRKMTVHEQLYSTAVGNVFFRFLSNRIRRKLTCNLKPATLTLNEK